MSSVIWFSRHEPTEAQLRDMQEWNGGAIEIVSLSKLASIDILDEEDLEDVTTRLEMATGYHQAIAIYGVFPTPVQAYLARSSSSVSKTPCYAAWNVKRSKEGGPATFEHKAFCIVGWI